MRVEETYSDDLWQNDLTSKPLSLIDFMGTANGIPFFKHSLELLEDISNHPDDYRYNVMQTCTGSGKSLIMDCQFLWHVYLMSLIKDPYQYFHFARSSSIVFGIIAPEEAKVSLLVESIRQLLERFDIFVTVDNWEPGKIGYSFINGMPVFKSTSGNHNLEVIRISSSNDLLGKNLLYVTGRELRNGYWSADDVYQVMCNAIKRIKARDRDSIISGATFDITPRSKDDLLDRFLLTAEKTGYLKVIRLKPIWELFPGRFPEDKGTFLIDLRSCQISKIVTETTIQVPMSLYKKAQFQTGIFIQDYIGLPVGYYPTPYMEAMDTIKDLLRSNNIDIILVKNKLCLQSPAGDILPLYDD